MDKIKILCVCDEGKNRSVHFASILKYIGDTIPIGLNTTSQETLKMLYKWADIILLTEENQKLSIPKLYVSKIKVYDVGSDTYYRPYNQGLYRRITYLLRVNPI